MPIGILDHLAGYSQARHKPALSADPFNRTMALVLSTLTVGEIVLARQAHLGGTAELLHAWPGFLLVIGSIIYCRRRPLPKLIDSAELAAWAVVSSNVLALMIQLAARSPNPLADAQIAALDRALHFKTSAIVHLVARVPPVQAALALTYAALPLLVLSAILIPPFFGRRIVSRRYLLSVIVAAIFTSVLFALWPACGPWMTENLRPTAEQGAITARLLLLKSAPVARLDFDHTAIVSFPSFHVVLAILSALALKEVRCLRRGAIALAGLTCVSTITTGWHYGFDFAGGVAVAAVAWSIASLGVESESVARTNSEFSPWITAFDDAI